MTSARLIYIGGLAFSGSTVLDALLGRLPGVVSLGEVHRLAMPASERKRSFGDRCSCGALLSECPTWRQRLDPTLLAREGVVGDWQQGWPISVYHRAGRSDFVQRGSDGLLAALPLALLRAWPPALPPFRKQFAAAEASWRLFDATIKRSGANFLVDSTKTPLRALALDLVRPGSARFVWIRRDLGSVFASHLKRTTRRRAAGRGEAKTMARLIARNAQRSSAVFSRLPTVAVSHRTLCLQPLAELKRIAAAIGMDAGLTPDLSFADAHLVPGNPLVWKGTLEIRPEFASAAQLSPEHQDVFDAWLSGVNRDLGYLGQ